MLNITSSHKALYENHFLILVIFIASSSMLSGMGNPPHALDIVLREHGQELRDDTREPDQPSLASITRSERAFFGRAIDFMKKTQKNEPTIPLRVIRELGLLHRPNEGLSVLSTFGCKTFAGKALLGRKLILTTRDTPHPISANWRMYDSSKAQHEIDRTLSEITPQEKALLSLFSKESEALAERISNPQEPIANDTYQLLKSNIVLPILALVENVRQVGTNLAKIKAPDLNVPMHREITTLFDSPSYKTLKKIEDEIRHNTESVEQNLYYIKAFHQLRSMEHELQTMYNFIAQIDVINSIFSQWPITTYDEQWTIPAWEENGPFIALSGHHPICGEDTLEDISIHEESDLEKVVRDPRKARSLGIFERLAQSIGIGPAKQSTLRISNAPYRAMVDAIAYRTLNARLSAMIVQHMKIATVGDDDARRATAKELLSFPENFESLPYADQLQFVVTRDRTLLPSIRYERILGLLGKQAIPLLTLDDEPISESTLQALDVLQGSGSKPEHCLARMLNKTQLHVGHTLLMRHLVQSKTLENLDNLQRFGKQLNQQVKVPEHLQGQLGNRAPLLHVVKNLLATIAPQEDFLLAFWNHPEIYDILYEKTKQGKFSWDFLDNQESMRWLNELWGMLSHTTGLFAEIASAASGNYLSILRTAQSLWNYQELYNQPKLQATYLLLMQQQLIALRSYIEQVEQLHTILQSSNIPQEITGLLQIKSAGTCKQELEKLKDLLKTSTFSNKESFISHWGRITTAYQLMIQLRDEFIPSYVGIGTLDFVASLNTLLQSSTERAPYCRPTIKSQETEREQPQLELKRCWCALIDPEQAVPNDIELGKQHRSIVITGPNGKGKTTIMRAALGAALLAQTLGVSPSSSHAQATPLTLFTTINVGDDPAQRLSRFQASAQHLSTIFKGCAHPDNPCLVAADELFEGTNQELAVSYARAYINRLASMPHVLSIFSSHLPTIIRLAEGNGSIANYRLAPGHKFEPGADSDRDEYTNTADAVVRQAFDENFMKEVYAERDSQKHQEAAR